MRTNWLHLSTILPANTSCRVELQYIPTLSSGLQELPRDWNSQQKTIFRSRVPRTIFENDRILSNETECPKRLSCKITVAHCYTPHKPNYYHVSCSMVRTCQRSTYLTTNAASLSPCYALFCLRARSKASLLPIRPFIHPLERNKMEHRVPRHDRRTKIKVDSKVQE